MIRVFPSLEHSGGACPHSARQFVGLLCSTYLCSRKKHNRAKPMSELPSALFSIADGSEFRFTRFYIVCEAVPLGAPESPLIVCGLSDTPRELSKRGKTQNSMSDVARKKYSDFTPKNCRCRLHLELIVFSLSIQNICHSMLQKSGSYFSSAESSRSFMLPYMPASFPRRASSNGMSAPAGSTSGL